MITRRRRRPTLPAARSAVLHRRAVRPGRGPRRPDRRDPRLRQVRPARRGPRSTSTRAVTALAQRPDGTWDVRIENGDTIHAEHVVNAGGLWAREVGRMVGHRAAGPRHGAPYLLTEDMPEVAAHVAKTGQEMPHGARLRRRDLHPPGRRRDAPRHVRAGVPCRGRRDETPWDFGSQLLKPDLDRITPELSVAFKHYPAMGTVGIQKVVNGPFTFSPDGNPLVGPIRGLRGYWVACGVMAGLSQGGGVGLALATWMTAGDHGDSGMDIWAMDVARYGDYATLAYTNAKVQENYRRRFRITFPNEELPAARPLLTTPIHDRLTARERGLGRDVRSRARAVVPAGRARADARTSRSAVRTPGSASPRRSRRSANGSGMTEISNYAKYRVSGPGAEAWLSSLLTQRMPAAGPDHADCDAQRRGQDRRRVHGRAGVRAPRVPRVRLAAGRGPPFALVPAPPAADGSRPLRGSRPGPDRACRSTGPRSRDVLRPSRRTSTSRPRRSRS